MQSTFLSKFQTVDDLSNSEKMPFKETCFITGDLSANYWDCLVNKYVTMVVTTVTTPQSPANQLTKIILLHCTAATEVFGMEFRLVRRSKR